jgi:flagellar biosynthesis/type III secretory pathway protein FliH
MNIKQVYRIPVAMPITETVTIGNTVYIPGSEKANETAEHMEIIAERDRKRLMDEAIERGIAEGVEKALASHRSKFQDEADRILYKAKQNAELIESDARSAVKTAMEIAQKDAEELRAKALEDGYKEGYDAAKTEALEKYNKYIDAVAKLLSDINTRKDAYFSSNEAELRATVYVIAEKIVKGELEIHPEAVERIIADAAKKYRNSKYLKISMPDNEEARKLKTDGSFIKQLIPFIEHIDVELLEDAPEGTVILDDDSEVTDASIPTQLDLLKEILRNTRGQKTE